MPECASRGCLLWGVCLVWGCVWSRGVSGRGVCVWSGEVGVPGLKGCVWSGGCLVWGEEGVVCLVQGEGGGVSGPGGGVVCLVWGVVCLVRGLGGLCIWSGWGVCLVWWGSASVPCGIPPPGPGTPPPLWTEWQTGVKILPWPQLRCGR